jgi:hypothetical protein
MYWTPNLETYSLYAAEVTIRQFTYSNKMRNKYTKLSKKFQNTREKSVRRGRDRMVVGFPTTYAISASYRLCCKHPTKLKIKKMSNTDRIKNQR